MRAQLSPYSNSFKFYSPCRAPERPLKADVNRLAFEPLELGPADKAPRPPAYPAPCHVRHRAV